MFDDAVRRTLGARRIYIDGLRSSSALAEFLYFYFNLIFEDVKLLTSSSSSVLSEQLLRANKGDTIIGISFPRYSRMTVDALEYAHGKGADVIAITDSPSRRSCSTRIARFCRERHGLVCRFAGRADEPYQRPGRGGRDAPARGAAAGVWGPRGDLGQV